MLIDKHLIQLRFAQAASTYEQEATVQLRVAEWLLALLAAAAPALQPAQILEIGCCTGLLTERLLALYPNTAQLSLCDLVQAFETCVCNKISNFRGSTRFLAGDIENVQLPGHYDLIISSSTLHWVHDLPALCGKLRASLNPEGILAFSLYGKDNLKEIRDITGVGLVYRTLEQLRAVVAKQFEILVAEESLETLWFPDPRSVLQHLRATGVNAIRQQSWTRSQLHAFTSEYVERFSGDQGVRLSYHPLFIVARPR
jgi:malonyl-CoA O-methyltransferase